MKCYLYSNEEMVGWAELINTDPPMGCASGPFYPNDNYGKIQPVIREYHKYDGTLGGVDGLKRTEAQAEIDALRLYVITEDGEVLDPAGGVHIADFSQELDEDPYQLDILGLPFDIFDRLFPLAWEEYLNHSEGKEQD